MSELKPKVKLYIFLVFVMAVTLTGLSFGFKVDNSSTISDILILLLVATFAENLDLVFAQNYSVTASPAIHVATIFLLSPISGISVAVVSILIDQIRNRKVWYKTLLNTSHHAIVIAVPSIFVQIGGNWTNVRKISTHPEFFIGALLVVSLYYLLDILIVDTVISLSNGDSFLKVWWSISRSVLLFDFTLPMIGIVAAVIWLQLPILTIFLLLPILVNQYAQSLIAQLKEQNESLDTVNQELGRKREVEQKLTRGIDKLTGQVATAFEEQYQNLNDQISEVSRVTATAEHLSNINDAIAKSANQVDNTAQKALRVVEEGTNTVRNGLKSLGLLNDQAQAINTAMNGVYNQARHIDQIIELITELADETNLLALNATIEASDAGVYGKRFAVIANEVQMLANRSRQASRQVRQVVVEVRNSIQKSSEVVQQGMTVASNAMKDSRTMEQTLEGIVDMVQHTAHLSRQISIAISEQRGATTQLVDTIHRVSHISHNVAQDSQNLLGSFYILDDAVARLNEV